MVDFQSRDTNRGVDDADADGDPADDGEKDSTDESTAAEDGATAADDEPTATTPEADAVDDPTGEVSAAILVTDGDGDGAADAVAEELEGELDLLGRDQRTDDLDAIQSAVNTFLDQSAVDAVVTVGGIGVGPTQVTVDAVEPLLDIRLPGFGELFRRRYEQQVGSSAVQTRVFAGVAGSTPVVALPADTEAARVATEELVVPELAELVAAAGEA